MAGNSSFAVTISAKDAASGPLAAINKRMASLNGQVAKAREPFDKLSANYGKFLKLTGADKIAGGLGRVTRAGFGAFQAMARIVEPLAAISGAASIAGMMRLATIWADFGTQLGQTATRAGLTSDQLQGLQGAARLAGVSADALTGGMTALRDNMVRAAGGKAPEVVAMMQALHLSFADASRYAADTTKALPELADKIAALKNPTLEAQAATALFGGAGEQLLPFLRKGSAGINEYNERAKKYGLVNADGVAAANNLREAQTGLTLAVEGLGNSVAEKLSPILTPLLKQLGDWIALNRDWIATEIGEKVKQFADFMRGVDWAKVGTDIQGIYHAVHGVVEALGGWMPVAKGLLAFFAVTWVAKMLLPIIAISKALLSLPSEAAVAATKAEAALAKVGKGELGKLGGGKGGLGMGLGAAAAGIAGSTLGAVLNGGPNSNEDGTFKHFPGGGGSEDTPEYLKQQEDEKTRGDALPWYKRMFAPHHGLLEGSGAPGQPGGPNVNLAGRGHDPNAARRDTSLPSGPNARGEPSDAAYKPLLDLIGRTEGTDKGRGYNETLGYGKFSGGDQNLTGMTLDQIDKLQQSMLDKQGNNPNRSSALGRYQFTQTTLRDMEKKYGIKGDQVFNEKMQDHLAALRIRMNGAVSQNSVAQIWASLPDAETGKSHYGQRTGATSDEVQAALRQIPSPSGEARNLPTNAGTAANPGGAGVMPNGQVQVGVQLAGLPPGAKTTATQTGDGLAPLKVERSPVGIGAA